MVQGQMVEHTNGWGDRELSERTRISSHFTQFNRREALTRPWAWSVEQAFTGLGTTVPMAQARAGDLVLSR
ncbi:hypothetical protein [Deinococcus hopiensis]|uniref:hypothetical protein n=1 Tax=Deinococcus hopiensis TaxID=309885 RepID=UPI0009FCA151|nr:hypothetical protein [Deinococcus hopiensis]